ncbi:MAG TPA: archaeosortase/exosortase family protein [Candidatus Acidoferrum sp.]|jgi:exosortase C (VPDSG-CTERM-specific)|nr:archaeosortase/exosortase family protein [Candidatus Acidoferrum sp.]
MSLEQPAESLKHRDRPEWLVGWILVLLVCFGPALWDLGRFAWGSELYSYILLIPFISGYLAWSKREANSSDSSRAPWLAMFPLMAAVGVLVSYACWLRSGWKPTACDQLAVKAFAFLCFLFAGEFLFLRTETLRRTIFAISFSFFIVPFPEVLRRSIEGFLQHRSADAAELLFGLAGMPVLRHETVLQLPGFTLEVAPECSGIHSTLVLFITSVVAGHLLLQSPWRRLILSVAVIPLALLRNGFRIVTIGELCVNVSPDMINSYIHRKGGPIFFVLSLIPFFLLLVYLRRGERNRSLRPEGSD